MRILITAFFVLIGAAAGSAGAQPVVPEASRSAGSHTISVTGDAMIRVVPDEVRIVLDISGRGRDLVKVQRLVDDTAASMIAAAHNDFQIRREYLQTDHMVLSPTYLQCYNRPYPECDPTRIDYLSATKGLVVRLQDIDRFEALMGSLIARGAREGVTVEVLNVSFLTNDLRQHRDKARELAAKAAKEKAEAVAAALGAEIGDVISVNVDQGGWYHYSAYGSSWHRRSGHHGQMAQNVVQNFGGGGGGPSPDEEAGFAPGQINVTANIRAVFALK